QMAQMLLKPAVADFMELASMADKLDLELDQIEIGPGSGLAGSSVGDSTIGKAHDVIVIAVQGPGGNVAFNPGSDRTLEPGDILIVMGSRDELTNLRRTADPSGVP
ncbi:MAG: potassium channel protein, partial [Gemmatimonadota bacterium]|nr:potassium channel protein [Gemmatimonadota bacterium]